MVLVKYKGFNTRHIGQMTLSFYLNILPTSFVKNTSNRSLYFLLISIFLTLFTFSCSVQSHTETKLVSFVSSALPGMPYHTQSFIFDESGYVQSVLYSSDGSLMELKSAHFSSTINKIQFPEIISSNSSKNIKNQGMVTDYLPSLMVIGHSRDSQLINYSSHSGLSFDYKSWLENQGIMFSALSQPTIEHKYYIQVLPLVGDKPSEIIALEENKTLILATQKLFIFSPLSTNSSLFKLLTTNRKNIHHPIIVTFKKKQFVFNIYRIN